MAESMLTKENSPEQPLLTSVVLDTAASKNQTSRYMKQLDKKLVSQPKSKVVELDNRSAMMNVLREKDFLRALASKGDLRTGKSVYENNSSQAGDSEFLHARQSRN
jgi:hypothetical protein